MNVRNKIMRLAAPVVVGFAAANGALAQTPLGSAWTYQGKLDLLGSPLNDTADFEFSLYDDPNGGAQIGSTATVAPIMLPSTPASHSVNSKSAVPFSGLPSRSSLPW